MSSESSSGVVQLSSKKFIIGSAIVAGIFFVIGKFNPFPSWFIALEVILTVLALFTFGSIKYRLDKNALTYGAAMIIIATFFESWWQTAPLKEEISQGHWGELAHFIGHHFFTLHGLDHLVHADTMLFILGLTFFVACIAQTRLLETASFIVLKKNQGWVVPTVAILAAIVSFSSGILDGVSMIGLMIRTMIIILLLSGTNRQIMIYAVMISTVVTTVCGMWLAYGEPPNLIMKANLQPHLDDAFFIRYCLPAAIGAYVVVAFNMAKVLKGRRVELGKLDILNRHVADVRFRQASRHGKVFTSYEFAESRKEVLGDHYEKVMACLKRGVPLGEGLVNEKVPKDIRLKLMGDYIDENLGETLDDYYVHVYGHNDHQADEAAVRLAKTLESSRQRRIKSQKMGALAFIPFVGLLVAHAINHDIPLFLASFVGFGVAFLAIRSYPKMRHLALHEAKHEFSEYLFLLPLFLSITLLQKTGFFGIVSDLLQTGIENMGVSHLAYMQFGFTSILSALLDNNVVADFAGRALQGLDLGILYLFAMAQIAGYALGGCWTHIGSAQSVVAYSFIRKEIDADYTPFQWIKAMTPIVLQIGIWMTIVVYGNGLIYRLTLP